MMSASLGVAIGPFLGGMIYDRFGGTGCFVAATVFAGMVFLAIFGLDTKEIDPWYRKQNTQPVKEKQRLSLSKIFELKAVPMSLCIFCLCFGYASLMSFYRLYGQSTGLVEQFNSFFLIYAAALLISRPMAGKLQDKFGDNAICYPCMAAQVIGIVLLAWKPCMLTIVVCAICGALGYGTLNSALNVIVNRRASDERRAYAVTTYWAFSDLGVGIAPAILGIVAGAMDYHAMYYAAALVSALAIPVYFLAKRR